MEPYFLRIQKFTFYCQVSKGYGTGFQVSMGKRMSKEGIPKEGNTKRVIAKTKGGIFGEEPRWAGGAKGRGVRQKGE